MKYPVIFALSLLSLLSVEAAPFISANSTSARVVGGQEAVPFKFPWITAIYQYGMYYCSGSMISPNVLMTAAHCSFDLFGMPLQPIAVEIKAHRHDLSKSVSQEQGINLQLKQVYNHPAFSGLDSAGDTSKPPVNDIALWHVSGGEALKIFPRVSVSDTDIERSRVGYNFGWGATKITSTKPSNILKMVRLPFVSDEQCNKLYNIKAGTPITHVCAGGVTGQSSCFGDSGSNLMVKDKMGKPMIVGITSSGDENCSGAPSFFTKVSLYKDWISQTMQKIKATV